MLYRHEFAREQPVADTVEDIFEAFNALTEDARQVGLI